MTDLPDGAAHWDGPGLDAWRAWTPAEAAERLAGVGIPWCVVGGWAIDLFAGRQTRPHGDLEIAVGRPDLPAVRRALPGHRFHVVGDGEVRALPAGADPPADRHQNWVLDVAAGAWRMDVMLEPGDRDTWVYRRDPTVRAPRAAMVGATPDGIPYLRPPAVLLFKAGRCVPRTSTTCACACPASTPASGRGWPGRWPGPTRPIRGWQS